MCASAALPVAASAPPVGNRSAQPCFSMSATGARVAADLCLVCFFQPLAFPLPAPRPPSTMLINFSCGGLHRLRPAVAFPLPFPAPQPPNTMLINSSRTGVALLRRLSCFPEECGFFNIVLRGRGGARREAEYSHDARRAPNALARLDI